MLEGGLEDPEGQPTQIDELAVGLERRDEHPIEGEQQEDRGQRQRQIERERPARGGRPHVADRLRYKSSATMQTMSTGNMYSEMAAPSDS